jgi:hypothetical protein
MFYAPALQAALHVYGYRAIEGDPVKAALNLGVEMAFKDLVSTPVPTTVNIASVGLLGKSLDPLSAFDLGKGRFGIPELPKNELLPVHEAEFQSRLRGVVQEAIGASAEAAIGATEEMWLMTGREKEFTKGLQSLADWAHIRGAKTAQIPISLPIIGRDMRDGIFEPSMQKYSIAGQTSSRKYYDTQRKMAEWIRLYDQGEHRIATKKQPTSGKDFFPRELPGYVDISADSPEGIRRGVIIAGMKTLQTAISQMNIPGGLKSENSIKDVNKLTRQFSDPNARYAAVNQLFVERMELIEDALELVQKAESSITDELAKHGINEEFAFHDLPFSPKTEGWGDPSPYLNKEDPFIPRLNQ